MYGQLLCGRTHDITAGVQFGNLALKLLERAPAMHMAPKVFVMVSVYILPWQEALTTTLQPLLESYHLVLRFRNNDQVAQDVIQSSGK